MPLSTDIQMLGIAAFQYTALSGILYAPPSLINETGVRSLALNGSDIIIFYYNVVGDEKTIKKVVGDSENVLIPAKIAGKPVTVIGPQAFLYMPFVTVVLPATVAQLEGNAFTASFNLEYVYGVENVEYIEPDVFADCLLLQNKP